MAQKYQVSSKPSFKHIPEGILVELVYAFCLIGVCLLISLLFAK